MKITWGRGAALLGVIALLGGCRHGGDGDVAQVRLINAVSNPDAVSVSVDHHPVWKRSLYGNNTGYQKIRPGTYNVEVAAGDAAASKDIPFTKGHDYTVLALNAPSASALGFRVFPDNHGTAIPDGKTRLHFIDAADAQGGVDVVINNIVAFPRVVYGHRTEALLLDSGSYDVRVNAPDSIQTLAGPITVRLDAGHSYTLVAMGEKSSGVTLEDYPDSGG